MYRGPIPKSYEATEQERTRDLAYTVRMMRRPRCLCCDEHILTETCLDLYDFGINGYVCERCVESKMQDTYELDNDNETGDAAEYIDD